MRNYDIVIFGATGFTGRLAAEYLAEHLPAEASWAIAGRSAQKLEGVRDGLGRPDLPILVADSSDPVALAKVAASTRVLITTVGPLLKYGEELVKACAEAGTDYLDLAGEQEFLDTMFVKYRDTATASGARIVHSAGFDSVPHDLGTYFTVKYLPEDVPITVDGVVQVSAGISGGTYHTVVNYLSRLRQWRAAARARASIEGQPAGRVSQNPSARPTRRFGFWLVPFPGVDGQNVAYSGRLLDRYGPDFTYRHWIGTRHFAAAAGIIGLVSTLLVGAQIKPLRSVLLELKDPGKGPTEAARAKSTFTVTFHGTGGDRHVICRVSGGDPGYTETSKILGEAAMSLAFDDLPQTAGPVTPAAAMGDALIDRLVKAGITFELVEERPAK
ncbi:saccharopine dehydrogenase NADP-binding domain-containing protein [Nocardia sp. NBC_00565]|uniref:saccharopine dehydrogenase family protein n=1 Tax=Nocardia sp. NBC_00565 TaxID=2975993 RepID=UPI002E7FFD7F|nr:saccharopine dehydrogenase NADP-binding domain-containing protein [Nocardia sp. NBC_00565]WUC03425.1 saccharopine dehydrogenase NADP-binding domain-containing protein [Nocardia sp. NBC_00565]